VKEGEEKNKVELHRGTWGERAPEREVKGHRNVRWKGTGTRKIKEICDKASRYKVQGSD